MNTSALSTKLLKQAQSLPRPFDYYEGRERIATLGPTNLIVFARLTKTDLLRHSENSHQHHRYVLIHCLEGEGKVLIDDRELLLEEGYSCLIHPFQLHYYNEIYGEKINWLFVTFELLSPAHTENLRYATFRAAPETGTLLSHLCVLWSAQREGLGACVSLILESLSRTPHPQTARISRNPGIYALINKTIHEKHAYGWNIERLASIMGYSAGHLRMRFRQETGLSLGRYLTQIRMNLAAGLLLQTTQSITDISEHCGYESIYAFSRAFGHYMGKSPTTYRNECRKYR